MARREAVVVGCILLCQVVAGWWGEGGGTHAIKQTALPKNDMLMVKNLQLPPSMHGVFGIEYDETYMYAAVKKKFPPSAIVKIVKATLETLTTLTLDTADKGDINSMTSDENYLYCGLASPSGLVVIVQKSNMKEVRQVQLQEGGKGISAIMVDSLYIFAGLYTNPGQIVKIEKAQIAGTEAKKGKWIDSSLLKDQSQIVSMQQDAQHLYCGCFTFPGVVVKVAKDTLQVVKNLTFDAHEDALFSMISDEAYLYIGTNGVSGYVIKVSKKGLRKEGVAILEKGENHIRSLAMDSNYIFAGTDSKPGRIVRIRKHDMQRVSVIAAGKGQNALVSMAADSFFLYAGTATRPGQVMKVLKSAAEPHSGPDLQPSEDMTRTVTAALASPENQLYAMLHDQDYIFVGTFSSPGRIIQLKKTDLSRVHTVELQKGQNRVVAMHMDNGHLYVGLGTRPGAVLKLDKSKFFPSNHDSGAAKPTSQQCVLKDGEDMISAIVVDVRYVYVATKVRPAVVVKIDKHTLKRVSAVTLSSDEFDIMSLVDAGAYLYASTLTRPGKIVKMDKDKMTRVTAMTLTRPWGDEQAWRLILDGPFMYAGTDSSAESPARIVQIRTADMKELNWLPLEPDDGNIRCMTFDKYYIYAGTDAEPGKIVQLRREDLVHVGTLTLEKGENSLMSMTIDATSVFVGTVTSPGRVVKIRKPGPPASNDPTNYSVRFEMELFEEGVSAFSGKKENWVQTGVAAALDIAFGDIEVLNARDAIELKSMVVDINVHVSEDRDVKEVSARIRAPGFAKRAAKFMHHFEPTMTVPTMAKVGKLHISPGPPINHHLYIVFLCLSCFTGCIWGLSTRRLGGSHKKVDADNMDEMDEMLAAVDDSQVMSGTPSKAMGAAKPRYPSGV
jgi:hypothetical protein